MKSLTAVSTYPASFAVRKVSELLDREAAVMPLDHRLPRSASDALIERMRPSRIATQEGVVDLPDGHPVEDDVELVIPTSGTTGEPKGVELSSAALRASAEATYRRLELSGNDQWLLCLPLAHIAGLSVLTRSRHFGTEPEVLSHFDPEHVLERGEGKAVSLVPTMLRAIFKVSDALPFKTVLLGGGPISQELIDRARQAGPDVHATYGMTETCGGCVYDGAPLEGVRIRIGDGSVIEISGSTLMERYRLDPAATEEAMVDGWLRTNDVGSLSSEGLLEVWGRADDLIITGGQKVAPIQVESALRDLPAVKDVAVVGAPDDTWGQAVVAVVVGDVELEEVRRYLRDKVPPYCIPKRIIRAEGIPRTALDKPDRAALRTLVE